MITPEEALRLERPTDGFMCPLSANRYGIEFLSFKIRDADSGRELFRIEKNPEVEIALEMLSEEEQEEARTVKYNFGPSFLDLENIGTCLEFKIGPEPLANFRMIERHYFKDELVKSFEFSFPFCMPNSINTFEALYDVPVLSEERKADMIRSPFESKSDSFYFVGDELIMHNKAYYAYVDYDGGEEWQ